MSKVEHLTDQQKLRLHIVEIMGVELMADSRASIIEMVSQPNITLPSHTIYRLSEIEQYILEGYSE